MVHGPRRMWTAKRHPLGSFGRIRRRLPRRRHWDAYRLGRRRPDGGYRDGANLRFKQPRLSRTCLQRSRLLLQRQQRLRDCPGPRQPARRISRYAICRVGGAGCGASPQLGRIAVTQSEASRQVSPSDRAKKTWRCEGRADQAAGHPMCLVRQRSWIVARWAPHEGKGRS